MVSPLVYIRRLSVALMISGALNIFLMSLFFYLLFKERPPTPYCELKPANRQEEQSPLAIDHSNSDVIRLFRQMPLEWLVGRLNNTHLVENGYTQRDLALASLVAFHQFDLERALTGLPQPDQKRTFIYGKFKNGKPATLTVYPGLSEKQYEGIATFASKERWPLTSKGLYAALCKQPKDSRDVSLMEAFLMTPDFLAVEMLFSRSETPVKKKELLEVLLQGDWTMLAAFVEQQKILHDLSAARRQRFLLDYIQRQSKAAAYLMLKTDPEVASKKLDDNHVMLLLQLLDEKSPDAERFAGSLLTSPRTDIVWKLAACRLYEYAGESAPERFHHHAALSRFVPQHTIIPPVEPQVRMAAAAPSASVVAIPSREKVTPPLPSSKISSPPVEKPSRQSDLKRSLKKERVYLVQEGDYLWKLSRRFNVDVDVLKSHNHLDTDFLRPGMSLRIP